jgi:hypothetical protein
MADPIITLTLLTPISVRLSWTGGNGDYEVWWKSDHPAGQEYVRLASVTGTTYDVGSLSWTTTYYFKVRPVGGAFGSEIHVFVCCGQAVVFIDTPSNRVSTSWQQSLDIRPDGKVAFETIARLGETVAIYLWDAVAEWSFFNEVVTPYLATEPFSLRYEGDRVMMYPFIFWDAKFWRHEYQRLAAFHDWELPPGLYGPSGYWAIEGLAVNSEGRVVCIMYKPSANPVFYAAISYNWGDTFSDPIVVLEDESGFNNFYTLASYEEGPDGAIWIAVIQRSGEWPSYVDRLVIYKYIVGEAPVLMATLGNELSEWMNNMLIIAVEEDKIGVYCVNDKYATPSEIPSIAISTDYGVNWALKPLTWAKTGKVAGQITISDGNIIVFSQRASDSVYCIYRSTDDGDSWAVVYEFDAATWYLPYYAFSVLESSGLYVGFTSCAMTLEPEADHNTGFLWSTDSGLTWTWIETPDNLSYLRIEVPA